MATLSIIYDFYSKWKSKGGPLYSLDFEKYLTHSLSSAADVMIGRRNVCFCLRVISALTSYIVYKRKVDDNDRLSRLKDGEWKQYKCLALPRSCERKSLRTTTQILSA